MHAEAVKYHRTLGLNVLTSLHPAWQVDFVKIIGIKYHIVIWLKKELYWKTISIPAHTLKEPAACLWKVTTKDMYNLPNWSMTLKTSFFISRYEILKNELKATVQLTVGLCYKLFPFSNTWLLEMQNTGKLVLDVSTFVLWALNCRKCGQSKGIFEVEWKLKQ